MTLPELRYPGYRRRFYALYAHLQPGSLKVKKGDAVKKGQAIALLGNSGNTTGPHLHFHVIHGKSPLGSDGVPYVIDSFAVREERFPTAASKRARERRGCDH